MATRTKSPKGSRTTVPNEDTFLDTIGVAPYGVDFTIEGTRGYLFNRYDVPANPDPKLKGQKVERKPEHMITLDSEGHLAARAVQLWNAVCSAGKYRPNPRSARGSLATVLKEAIEIEGPNPKHPDLLTFVSPEGKPYDNWEFDYSARVKNAGAFAGYVTRVRPGIEPGWALTGRVTILLPEYITVPILHEAFSMAGRFGGIGDGRSGGLGFGKFLVRRFDSDTISL